jgi:hypothetical protein
LDAKTDIILGSRASLKKIIQDALRVTLAVHIILTRKALTNIDGVSANVNG